MSAALVDRSKFDLLRLLVLISEDVNATALTLADPRLRQQV